MPRPKTATINIDPSIQDQVPVELLGLKDFTYEVTKMREKNDNFSGVSQGHVCIGTISVISYGERPCLAVNGRGFRDCLRTSPIVSVLEQGRTYLIVETLNSLYKIRRVIRKKTKD